MQYIEITKFCRFINEKRSSNKVREGERDAGAEFFYSEINGYDINPVLKEMQLNFSENWHNERMVNQLYRDYEKYLEIIDAKFKPFSSGDYNMLKWKKLQLQKQLKLGSFLDPSRKLEVYTSQKNEKDKESDRVKGLLWFQVGLKFASGEIKEHPYKELSTPKIRKILNLPKGADKYLLATIKDYRKTNKDKNIYASKYKMDFIANHCQSKDIPIDEDFIGKWNSFKARSN